MTFESRYSKNLIKKKSPATANDYVPLRTPRPPNMILGTKRTPLLGTKGNPLRRFSRDGRGYLSVVVCFYTQLEKELSCVLSESLALVMGTLQVYSAVNGIIAASAYKDNPSSQERRA